MSYGFAILSARSHGVKGVLAWPRAQWWVMNLTVQHIRQNLTFVAHMLRLGISKRQAQAFRT